jgi:hypothetical protein
VQSLQISPVSTSLAASAQQLYTTWATLSDGRNFPGNGVAFSATGGTITSEGLYTAPTTGGNYTITSKVVGGTASATASVAVTAPTTTAGSGAYPNMPTGLATLVESEFSALPTSSGWTSSTMRSGSITHQVTSNAVIASDATAPVSPPGIFRTIMPSGLADGVSPVTTKFWQYTGSTNDFNEIYVSFWIRVTGNGTNFENQSVGQKLFYFAEGSTTRENQSPLFLDGDYATVSTAPNGTKMTSAPLSWYIYEMRDDGTDAGGGSVHHGANVNSSAAVLQVGKWYHIEVYGKINTHNSDPAPHDGIARIWVNGVLTHDYSPTRGNGIRWASALNPYGFYMLSWVPVWGGDIGQVKNQTDYLDLDHLYIAVR